MNGHLLYHSNLKTSHLDGYTGYMRHPFLTGVSSTFMTL